MSDTTLDEATLYAGGGIGLVAFLAGYLLTGVLFVARTVAAGEAMVTDTFVRTGWRFYASHGVPIVAGGARVGTDGLVPVVVPAAVLVLAGWVLVDRRDRVDAEAGDAAVTGAAVTTGYLFGAVACRLVLVTALTRPFPAAPALVETVLYAGLAFPLVFGGLGGYVGARFA
ncbi:hypothetical protein [Haloarchaeobius iranensis]|uniref:DUF7978 domain-containing protein n=1 Tax=Haloarchaeobius iranensis TaxID=996166 RepID=A0A1G9X1C0_9EURY|nr:hypothetical protein [Haloarchaeobius iranensis]SDM90544.1 hypothetical protein SAMN05192554_109100 [Haloarchaeobius iranensis]